MRPYSLTAAIKKRVASDMLEEETSDIEDDDEDGDTDAMIIVIIIILMHTTHWCNFLVNCIEKYFLNVFLGEKEAF